MTTAIVTVQNGKPMTNSRDVAELFGRLHKNVLQSIERLECSPEFNRLNFQPIEYRDERGRLKPSYNMTKDGFTFLAMGYTGSLAARFKEAYIQRFNEMEEQLRPVAIGSTVGAYRVAEYFYGEWPLRVLWTETGPLQGLTPPPNYPR